jgi:protein-S-isoprenylcysteine O-methyltransferase Ste14
MDAMPSYVYVILALGWFFWFLPFPLKRWNQGKPQTSDHRSRWGMLLQVVAYALLWQGHFWVTHPSNWRIAASAIFVILAVLLSWTATNALGRHLRFDAAVTPDHELIRTGPYAIIRHPIYASMLAILLGTGVVLTPPMLFIPAIIIFLIGTEIRVRTEDNLLATHFGDQFRNYRQHVSAYIPLIR